jgi:hypothetical protein
MAGIGSLPQLATALRVVIPISGVHRGIVDAVAYAKSIAADVTAVYVELEPGSGEGIRQRWQRWWPDVPLVILPSPYRSIVGPLLGFLDEIDGQHNYGQLATVVLPGVRAGQAVARPVTQPDGVADQSRVALPTAAVGLSADGSRRSLPSGALNAGSRAVRYGVESC